MNPLKLLNPVTVIKGAVGLAGTAVGVAEAVVRGPAHIVRSALQRLTTLDHLRLDEDEGLSDVVSDAMTPSADLQEPADLPVEPRAPDESPIDVVGEALASESARGDAESLGGAGFAHEPRVASRAEEHGDAPSQQAEREEIDDEVTASLEEDLEDDAGPEEHLSQPLLEPGSAKALATEAEMMSRAADPNKS
jgi:hypothetical protein